MYQNIFVKNSRNEAWIWDDEKGLIHFNYRPYAYRPDPSGKYKSLHGQNLSKVTNFIRNDPGLLESDVPETTRLLIDRYHDSDMPSTGHKIMTFDIEVEMITGTPDATLGNNAVTSIAFHDSVTDEYTVLILDTEQRVETRSYNNRHIISCPDEKILLLKFLDRLEVIGPTIFTGWNIDVFDIPYLYNRILNTLGKTHAYRLSPIGELFYSPNRDRYTIAGISSIDYMSVYKKFAYKELPSYALNYVANNELGRGKIEYEGNLDDLMSNDIDMFIEYNITDVELVVELDRKLQYIDLVRNICHVGHVPYDDYQLSSKYLEGALMTHLKRVGVVAPNKPVDGKEKLAALRASGQDGFIGAYVKDPIPGIHEWVYDLDLTSLYPSIIMTLNISPETKVAKIEGWDAHKHINGITKSYVVNGETISAEVLTAFLDKYKYTVASNGMMYRTDIIGLIPAVLNEWFNKRVEYNQEMDKCAANGDDVGYSFYDKRQLVQKILLNSLYGVLGLCIWRFYDVDNAEATTTSGRTIIQKTQDVINRKYNVELGDVVQIEFENGSFISRYANDTVSIVRDGIQQNVLAKELVDTDDVLEVV